ncbi:MAG: DUF4232 domain-containing protein [Actinomycetota bacterium]|nr:DUF4232 domain-containing protein [Actinomycetota bacterium]
MRRDLLLLLLVPTLAAGCAGSDQVAAPTPQPKVTATALPTVEPVDPLSPKPAIESPAPLGRPTCAAGALAVQDADLLADETQLQEVFAVRTSGSPCQLSGWPEVTLLGPDDAPLVVTVRRTGSASPESLSRGTSLSFVLSTPRTSDCQDVSGLVVRLPGTSRAIRTSTTMQVCHGELGVSPVQRRQDDEGAEH